MLFEEPRIEFVAIDTEDILTGSAGAAVEICAPGSAEDDE